MGEPLTGSTRIGITMGCPVGIGPEIILKFLAGYQGGEGLDPVVIGDLGVLRHCARTLGIQCDVLPWQPGEEYRPGTIMVRQPAYPAGLTLDPKTLVWGRPSRATGVAMAAAIEQAVGLVQAGELAAMVTCPITKAALQEAGYHYPGHTEMLAALCQTSKYAMMLAAGPAPSPGANPLRVTLVTIHQSLSSVAPSLTQEGIRQLIELTGRSLQIDFGIPEPRLAVAGLNPHAGEGGLFGDEEERIIAPAVASAQARGWQVSGPWPPDTLFIKAVQGHYDAVVCMYHDQGLIPFKLLHFADGVNVTIGLPIIRTSVDHGTAYDIAGQGMASPESLQAAFRMAAEMVGHRQRAGGED